MYIKKIHYFLYVLYIVNLSNKIYDKLKIVNCMQIYLNLCVLKSQKNLTGS